MRYCSFSPIPPRWLLAKHQHLLLGSNPLLSCCCCHAACTSFSGLFAVHFLLRICEGAITSGFMIVTSMFYTRAEQTCRVGYWCQSPVLVPQHVSPSPSSPYEWLLASLPMVSFIPIPPISCLGSGKHNVETCMSLCLYSTSFTFHPTALLISILSELPFSS